MRQMTPEEIGVEKERLLRLLRQEYSLEALVREMVGEDVEQMIRAIGMERMIQAAGPEQVIQAVSQTWGRERIRELLEQTEVWAIRTFPLTEAATPETVALEISGDADLRRDDLTRIFERLNELSPKGMYTVDGEQVELPMVQGHGPLRRKHGADAMQIVVEGHGDTIAARQRSIVALREWLASPELSAAIDEIASKTTWPGPTW